MMKRKGFSKAVTVKEIQRLDRIAIRRLGIPSVVLMENAGRGSAEYILKRLKNIRKPRACIVCGLGNNAGDGFVIARHLLDAGVKTHVYFIGSAQKLKQDARVNYVIFKKLKGQVRSLRKAGPAFKRDIAQANMIIDAIFGVGLNRAIQAPFKAVIDALNASQRPILAVDTPSGLDATTGKIYGTCVKARTTVTFSFLKKGFLKNQGPAHTGKTVVIDIGIPKQLIQRMC